MAFDRDEVSVESVVHILREYEKVHDDRHDHSVAYRRVLQDRPWQRCPCEICRQLGVHVILFRFLTTVPAYVALGLWFLFQFVSGIGLLGGGTQEGGVAYAAHVGGFIAGLALVKVFAIGRAPAAPRWRSN